MEDDVNSREALKAVLSAEGYQVETAEDGFQAINMMMKAQAFAAAILDLTLPPVLNVHIDGWDLIRIFRSYNPAMAIIAVSGEKGFKERAEQCGVSAFLEKPIYPAQLKSTLADLGL